MQHLWASFLPSLFLHIFPSSSAPWFVVCSLGLRQAAQVSSAPRCFAALWRTTGGCQTTGRPQLPEEEQPAKSFKATEELRKISCGTMKELMQLVEPISGLCYCHKIVFCLLNVRKHVTVVCLWNGPQLMSILSLNTLGVTQTETATTCKTSGSDNAKFDTQRNGTVYCFPHTVLTFSQFLQLFKSKELKSLIKACLKSEPGSGKCVWQSQPAAP